MLPAFAPVAVDGHVWGPSGCEIGSAHGHANRHHLEGIEDGTEEVTGEDREDIARILVRDEVFVDKVGCCAGQNQARNITNEPRNESREETQNPVLLVDLLDSCTDARIDGFPANKLGHHSY